MECRVCKKSGEVRTATGTYCQKCFVKLIEKRVRKEVRLEKVINPKMKILCLDEVSEFLIRSMYKGSRCVISIIKKVPSKIPQGSMCLIPWSMDDEITQFLYDQLHGERFKKSRIRTYSILKSVTDEELEIFAEFYGLRFIKNKKDKDVYALIDGMHKKYPETKYALYKTSKQIKA